MEGKTERDRDSKRKDGMVFMALQLTSKLFCRQSIVLDKERQSKRKRDRGRGRETEEEEEKQSKRKRDRDRASCLSM